MKLALSKETAENWSSAIEVIEIASIKNLSYYKSYEHSGEFFGNIGLKFNGTDFIEFTGSDLLNFYGYHDPLVGVYWFKDGYTFCKGSIEPSAFGNTNPDFYCFSIGKVSVKWNIGTVTHSLSFSTTDGNMASCPLYIDGHVGDDWITEHFYPFLWLTQYPSKDDGLLSYLNDVPVINYSSYGYRFFGAFVYHQSMYYDNGANFYGGGYKYSIISTEWHIQNYHQYGNALLYDSTMLMYSILLGDLEIEFPKSPIDDGVPLQERNSDYIGAPDVPLLDAITSKAVIVYKPTATQVNNLMGWLWTENFIDVLGKIFTNPMEAIISLSILPIDAQALGTAPYLKIGNATSTVENVAMVDNQYTKIDMGSLKIPEFWGNFTDYESTNVDIFLPFIGTQPLNIYEIMNSTVNLYYYVDIITGQVLAMLKVKSHRGNIDSVLYSWTGNCAIQIPLSSQNYLNTVSSLITGTLSAGISVATGNPLPLLIGATNTILNSQSPIQHSGTLATTCGYLGVKTPYLIFSIPELSTPKNYKNVIGKPINIYDTLSNFTGYTTIENCHLDDINCTDAEKTEIFNILREGIII